MSWKRKKNLKKSRFEHYSISKKLRREGKSNDEFETMLSLLPLEDVIALKLELSTRPINGRLYSIPIWKVLPNVVKEAAFKFAYSCCRTQFETMAFLGLEEAVFYDYRKKFKIKRFFED